MDFIHSKVYVIVPCHGHLTHMGFAHRPDCISLKPLDGFSPFEVVWNFLLLYLCDIMVVCPFAPYGLAHEPKTCQICYHWVPDFVEPISLKLLDGFTLFWELSRPVVVQCCHHLLICPIWACPGDKNLSNLICLIFCPFDQYGLAHGPEHVSLKLMDRLLILWFICWGMLLFSECFVCIAWHILFH